MLQRNAIFLSKQIEYYIDIIYVRLVCHFRCYFFDFLGCTPYLLNQEVFYFI